MTVKLVKILFFPKSKRQSRKAAQYILNAALDNPLRAGESVRTTLERAMDDLKRAGWKVTLSY